MIAGRHCRWGRPHGFSRLTFLLLLVSSLRVSAAPPEDAADGTITLPALALAREAPEGHIPAVVIAGRPSRVMFDGVLCGLRSAPEDKPTMLEDGVLSPAEWAASWLEIALADTRESCDTPEMLRLYVGAPEPWRERSVSAVLQAEARVAEVRGDDLAELALVAILDGRVQGVAPCLGERSCALPVDREFMRTKARGGRAELMLWPSAVALEVGAPLPMLRDAAGHAIGREGLFIPEVVLSFLHPLVATRQLNVAAERTTVPLVLPEAVKDVRCRRASCVLVDDGVEIFGIDPSALAVTMLIDLVPGAERVIDGRSQTREQIEIPLVRCAMQPLAGVPLLAGIANHRYLIVVARDCFATEPRELLIETRPPTYAWVRGEVSSADRAWRVFEVIFEKVPAGLRKLELTLVRRDLQRTSLGAFSIPVEEGYLPVIAGLEIPNQGLVDFIPTNREARVVLAFEEDRWGEDIRVESRRGLYRVRREGPDVFVHGTDAMFGSIPLRLAYRPQALENALGRPEVLARIDTEGRFRLRAMNVPVPLVSESEPRVVEVMCRRRAEEFTVPPGRITNVPYRDRDSCSVTIDRSAIPPEAGEQQIRITTGGKEELLLVSHGEGTVRVALSAGDQREFSRLLVAVGHEYSGGHYDLSPRHSIGPEARYRIVLGDRPVRISAGTALPTGLFRFGRSGGRGSIPLSAGATSRLALLYREGNEFPIGLELGILGTDLSETAHLSFIGGIGFSIPVLNPDTVLQTSFNIHAWAEYSPTRRGDGESPWAFLFGPSFSVGRFSTTL